MKNYFLSNRIFKFENQLTNLSSVVLQLADNFDPVYNLEDLHSTYWTAITGIRRSGSERVRRGMNFNSLFAVEYVEKQILDSGKRIVLSEFSRKDYKKISMASNLIRDFSDVYSIEVSCASVSTNFFKTEATPVFSGSDFGLPGFLFVCFHDNEDELKLAERVLHESMHNILFFEEMANGLFYDIQVLSEKAFEVGSAILRKKRRFDYSFHALCVAVITISFFDFVEADIPGELRKYALLSLGEISDMCDSQKRNGIFLLNKNGESVLESIKLTLLA